MSLVPQPNGKNIISCKWVLTKKFDSNGKLDRVKVGLVARGFIQIHGINCKDTLTITPSYACMYIKWHTTCMPNGDHAQFDVHYIS